jgi:hypothetical protein
MSNLRKVLQELLEGEDIPQYQFTPVPQDASHAQRRAQQRGISDEHIQIALLRGYVEYLAHAKTYTLTDRRLMGTKFAKYADDLRGVRLVTEPPANPEAPEPIQITTVMWAEDIRSKRPRFK